MFIIQCITRSSVWSRLLLGNTLHQAGGPARRPPYQLCCLENGLGGTAPIFSYGRIYRNYTCGLGRPHVQCRCGHSPPSRVRPARPRGVTPLTGGHTRRLLQEQTQYSGQSGTSTHTQLHNPSEHNGTQTETTETPNVRWNNKQTSWEPVRSDHCFFPVLVLLPSRVRILGWMGPHWALWPCGRAGVWWAAQWNVCRAGGAAGPLWPHSPTLHGYRGLYGSPRTACWALRTMMAARGGRAASHAAAYLAGGDAKYIWLTRQWGTCVYFLKNVQTAETLLKAYTYKQHECDYHIPTVYMVLGLPGVGVSTSTLLSITSHATCVCHTHSTPKMHELLYL